MFKPKCMFLCLCYLFINSYANLVPCIEKCHWQHKACLVASAQKCIPSFAAGISELGTQALDPLTIDKVLFDEGALKIVFKDMTVTGASKCKVIDIDIDRNLDEQDFVIKLECAIEVHGTYKSSGKILTLDTQGEGPFLVNIEKGHITVKAHVKTVIGSDGEKHWKIGKTENSYEIVGKTIIKFDNLFHGDPEKAEALNALLQQNSKDMVQTVGKPIVLVIIERIVFPIKALFDKVSISNLEKPSN